MKAYRVRKYGSPKRDNMYQSKNFFIRYYFYKRLDIALKMSDISKDDVVLDVGTHEGFLVPSLLMADKVYAFDIRYFWELGQGKPLLYWAKNLLTTESGKNALEKVLFFYADAAHLPLQDKTLDIVFALDCIEHMPIPTNEFVIFEAWRVLKEGGVFICSLPIEKGSVLLLREIIRRIMRYSGPRYSLKELFRAFIHNEAIGEWTPTHGGYDYLRDLKIINSLFNINHISHAPLPFLFKLNPTVVIKATKNRKNER